MITQYTLDNLRDRIIDTQIAAKRAQFYATRLPLGSPPSKAVDIYNTLTVVLQHAHRANDLLNDLENSLKKEQSNVADSVPAKD